MSDVAWQAEQFSKMRIHVTSFESEFQFQNLILNLFPQLAWGQFRVSWSVGLSWSGWVPFVREYLSMVADRASGSLPNALLAKAAERLVNWGWCAT